MSAWDWRLEPNWYEVEHESRDGADACDCSDPYAKHCTDCPEFEPPAEAESAQ